MVKRVAIFIFIVLAASVVFADPRFTMGVTFTTGFPQGSFRDNVGGAGFGVSWDGLFRVSQHSPFSVGGSLGFVQYGSQNGHALLSGISVPDVILPTDTSNNILLAHFLVRYQPGMSHRKARPYIDGLFGLNYLWTQTSVGHGSDQLITTNFSDTTLSYGAGGGLDVCLHQANVEGYGPVFRLDLNMGVRYLIGGEANYLNLDSLHEENGSVFSTVNRSKTNLLVTDVGISFSF